MTYSKRWYYDPFDRSSRRSSHERSRRGNDPQDTPHTDKQGDRRRYNEDEYSHYDKSPSPTPTFSSIDPVLFDDYVTENTMSVVACHAEGEACDVVVGGIPHVRGQTMLHKQIEFMSHHEWRRDQLLNEPRGRCGLNAVFLLPPCSLGAKCGLLFAKNDEYVPVSVSSMIAAAHVIVNGPDAEIDRLKIPTTRFTFDTIAGAVDVDVNLKRESSNGFNIPKCQAVTVHGIPSFVFGLDYELDLYGLGQISIDVAYGGVICAFVDADSVGVSIHDGNGQKMIEIGERIKNALRELHDFVHPVQADLHGVSTVVFTDRVDRDNSGSNTRKKTNMAAVISPGRLDRSPSGTAVFARLAVLYARGDISKETLSCQSIIGTRLYGRIRGKTMVDKYEAILPSVTGRAWIHSLKQVGMNPGDPFPEGFRGADQWGPDEYKRGRTVTYDPHNLELPSGW